MKNFPHQINRIDRLTAGLGVFAQLQEAGSSLADDGIVGQALAVQGVYSFRDKNTPLAQLLELERDKPESSQGTRTCARDLRRLFVLLGLLERPADADWRLTTRAADLLAVHEDTERRNEILRQALGELELRDEAGNVSHPYRILLRLVEERPGISGEFLGLCLEAEDDSEQEFMRLLELADSDDWEEVCQAIEVSSHQARNAIKILPALARQLGDIIQSERGYIREGQAAPQAPPADRPGAGARVRARPRPISAAEIGNAGTSEKERDDPTSTIPLDPSAIQAAKEMTRARTIRHDRILHEFADALELAGYELFVGRFDCLGVGSELSVLCEVKTLDGTPDDELVQVRASFGQLHYYERFDIPIGVNRSTLKKVAIFESSISTEHQAFLEEPDCIVLWKEGDTFTGTARGLALLRSLGMI